MAELIFSIFNFQGCRAFPADYLEVVTFSACFASCSSLDPTIFNNLFCLFPSLVACCLILFVSVVTTSTSLSDFLFGSLGCSSDSVAYGILYSKYVFAIDTDKGCTYIISFFMVCLTTCDSLSFIPTFVKYFFIIVSIFL